MVKSFALAHVNYESYASSSNQPYEFQTKRLELKKICEFAWHPMLMRLGLNCGSITFHHTGRGPYPHALFSRFEPGREPRGSCSTCHCRVGLSNRSAVEKSASKIASAKQKQLAQKTVGNRDYCASRLYGWLVDGVAQGCNIRSPTALA
jgi:hypothetical protein